MSACRTLANLAFRRSAAASCAQAGLACAVLFGAATSLAADGEPWIGRRQAGLFFVRSEFALDDHATLLDELAELDHQLAEFLGLEPAADTIEVFLFKSKSSYRDYVRRHYPEAPARQALFIKGAGRGMVFTYLTRDLAIDVRHEATHAVLHNTLASLPLWLDEGLAEYFEVPAAERADHHPHLAAVRRSLWWGVDGLVRLERIEQLDDFGRRQYRDAWAWVHLLLHGPAEIQEVFVDYLAQLAAGRDVEPLSRRLIAKIGDPEKALEEHLRNWNR